MIPKIMPQKTPKLSDLKRCLFSCSRAVGRLRLGWTLGSGLRPQRGFESVPCVSHRPGSSSRWGLRSPLHGVPLGPRLKGQGPLRHVLKHKRALPHGPWVRTSAAVVQALPRWGFTYSQPDSRAPGTCRCPCFVVGKFEARGEHPIAEIPQLGSRRVCRPLSLPTLSTNICSLQP